MVRPTTVPWLAVVSLTLVLLTAATPVAAASDAGMGSAETMNLGSHDIALSDLELRVEDVHAVGPGLPDHSIDRARYTVDEATVTADEFSVTVGDRTIEVGEITLTLDDVGVTFEDVSTGSPDG